MSGSKQKLKRQEEKKLGIEKRQVRQQQQDALLRKQKICMSIAGVVIVLLLFLIFFFKSSFFYRNFTAVKVNDVEYSVADVNYYYHGLYNNYYSSYYSYYGDYASSLMPDKDALENSTLEMLKKVSLLYTNAKEADYTLSEAGEKEIEKSMDSLKEAAESAGYSSLNKYLRVYYGNGVNETVYKENLEMYTYDFIYDINTVSMTIVQPRLENISTFTCSVDELKEWAESYVRPRALLAYKGEGDMVPGEHCRFCRAKPRCRACADEALKLAKYEFQEPELLEHEEIEDMLPSLNRISRWIESVFTFVSDEAINNGVSWEGYKVVEGRSKRTFVDEKAVAEAAVEAGYTDIYKQSLISLTEFEKLMGKKNFQQILGSFVYKPSGKLTLVPEEDKRPAVDLGMIAAGSEFEVLD